VTNTRAYTETDGLDDGRSMFAILSFEGVLNFTAEERLYHRIGAHLLDVDGTLPRSISTPSRDRLSGNPVDDFDDQTLSMQQHVTVTRGIHNSAYGLTTFAIVF
jgi:hypothetical protein